MALDRNPAIRAAEQRVAAMAQRIPQATSLEDPMIEVAPIGEMAETASGMVGVMTGVSQRFPLGAKLSTAGHVAEAEVAAAIADLDATRSMVANEVRQAYWRFYESTRALEVIHESQTILELLAQAADAQYRAGQVSQQDVLRATTELSELEVRRATVERQAGSAQSMLNQLMDRPIDAEFPQPPHVELNAMALRLDDLLAIAIANNPSLRQIGAEIETDRQRVRLARAERVPDLKITIAYNFVNNDGLSPAANGNDQWWIGFGINLPIWQERLDAAEREARLNELRAISTLANERNITAFQVRDAVLAAETAQRRAALFQDEILPQARQTLDASLAGYRAGRVDFLTLASNWRRVLEFQLMLHENVAELNRALANIEQVVGSPLSSNALNSPVSGIELDQSNTEPALHSRGDSQ